MFDFIKKLFEKEKAVIVETVNPHNVATWFESKVGNLEVEVKEKKDYIKSEISQRVSDLREFLKKLEGAELRNPNISTREKHFMEGNRKAYLHRTEQFIREVEDIIEYELAFFLSHYGDYVNGFLKSTSRSYHILQQFFANEVKDIAMKIKEIDELVDGLKHDEKIHNHSRAGIIRKELVSLENKIKKLVDLEDEVNHIADEIKGIVKKEAELKQKLNDMKDRKEFKESISSRERINEIDNEIDLLKKETYSLFSLIERPLKKYQRIAFNHGKLIEHYLVDSFAALKTDMNLNIVEVLRGLSANLESGKLTDKKADKIIARLKNLDKNYFKRLVHLNNTLKEEAEKLHREWRANKIVKEVDRLHDELKLLAENHHELKRRREAAKAEADTINVDHLRDKLKQDIEDMLGVQIEFKVMG